MNKLFCQLLQRLCPCADTATPKLTITQAVFDRTVTVKGDLKMVTLTSSQQVGIRVSPTDKRGNPAPLDGVAQFVSSDDGIATVVAGSDGISAVVKATGPIGACQVIVTGDADLGEGIVTLQGVLDVNVIAGQAASFGITNEVPTEQE